jgi:tRNA 2-selenouridine synthase
LIEVTDYSIDISRFLEKSRSCPVLDVRSPAEYDRGHIPGALSLPLFNNEERSVVGTLYLQKGSKEAMMKGLELVGPKMKEFVSQASDLTTDGELLLYCWRGGMRSNSMAWLFNTSGMKSHTLEGGYKSWRKHIHDFFGKPLPKLLVIGGMTGTGKTEILEEIEKRGGQVIHLEQLARHKGSVFGHIGMPQQPSTEQFENELYTHLSELMTGEPVFIEDESLAIGQVFIPKPFFARMSSSKFINVLVPFDDRVKRLVESYTGGEPEFLVNAVKRIERRLGSENAELVRKYIRERHMERAVEIVLGYYDKVYARSMEMHKRAEVVNILVKDENPKEIAGKILEKMINS